MLIRRVCVLLLICAVALFGTLIGLASIAPAMEKDQEFDLAIPESVTIVVGQDLVIVTGIPDASISPVNCAPGTPRPHSAVIVDPGGGRGARRSDILIFAEADMPAGTRLRITGGPTLCSGELTLYRGTVE